jgi:hypothetical protein
MGPGPFQTSLVDTPEPRRGVRCVAHGAVEGELAISASLQYETQAHHGSMGQSHDTRVPMSSPTEKVINLYETVILAGGLPCGKA